MTKIKRDKSNRYENAFNNFCRRVTAINEASGEEAAMSYWKTHYLFYAIKYIGRADLSNQSEKQLGLLFGFCSSVRTEIKELTPREFATFFPIRKTYDGEKWGNKDYYHVMKYINGIGGLDVVIGERDLEFLYNYDNADVLHFIVISMSILSEFRKRHGEVSLIDDFFDYMGVETFTEHDFGTGVTHFIGSKGTSHIFKDGVGFQTNIGGFSDDK
ncbi:hypothetical protein EP56_15145 [Listeriaceae bacterium FSL A5-0209]|nr:hypothetical protein EP56_15145 [Listeriaceae bacterium FSL A5-0209]